MPALQEAQHERLCSDGGPSAAVGGVRGYLLPGSDVFGAFGLCAEGRSFVSILTSPSGGQRAAQPEIIQFV